MPFKPLNLQAMDITKKKDQPIVGTFTGKRVVQGDYGPQSIWEFADEEGMPFGIYGFGNLNTGMSMLPIGTRLRLTYKGKVFAKTKRFPAGKDIHQVLIETDTEQPGAGAPALAAVPPGPTPLAAHQDPWPGEEEPPQ